jgi:gliding motility-associated-like protein
MKVSRTQASISRCGTGSTWICVALQGLVPGVLVLGAGSALAQCTDPCSGNLLSNPDFELNTTVCTTINNGQLYIDQSPVQDWFGTAGVNSPQNGITPDNFNSGCLGNSTNNCGSGAGSIGFFTRVATNGREYVQSQLLEPLEAGAEYCFSVFVKKGSGSTQQPNNGLGIWFTDQQVNITTMNNGASYLGPGSVVNATPYWQLADGDLINTCVQRTGTFCATGGETWIVIGNFRNDANTSIATGGNFNNGYLIIDNLSLTKVCPENTTPLELEASATVLTCGANATLEASGGSGTYTWIPNIGAGAGPFTVAPAETTTYAVVSGSQGTCGLVSDTVEVTITVEPCDHIVTLTAGETCPGGCVDLLTTIENDNVPPYTYTWSDAALVGPGPHSVCPAVTTTYTLTVTDGNGSAVSVDAVAVVLDAPQVTTTSTAVSCPGDNDGSATVTPSGGTAPFQHSWNTLPPQSGTTVTGIASGTYTVTTTDANGCVSSAEVMVEEPAPLVLSVDATDANCGQTDGSATATASGGVGPYDYEWSTTPVQTTATAADLGAGSYTVTATDANGCTATQSITISSTGVGVLQTSATDATCNGLANGSASATLAGGAEPVAYVWNTTPAQNTAIATGLPAGSWTVTAIEANGCISSATVNIEEPTPIQLEVSVEPVPCGAAGGTALALATGGTGAFNFVWDTDPVQNSAQANGLETGTYTVTVTDANGCSATAEVNVAIAAPLELTVEATDAECGQTNGSATATASGGVGPYDYEWSTTPVQTTATATDLGAGSYIVTATDANGCTATQSITITSPAAGVLQTSATDATCNGLANGSASATLAGGAEPVEYVWNTTPAQNTATATGLAAGSWTVTATEANGCTSSATVTVLEPAPVVVQVGSTAASCGAANGTALATASGGTGALSIVWDTDPPQSTATASGLEEGSYTVTVTDANGCSATADALVEGSPGPVAGFTGGEACQGAVSTFTSTAANATQWDWDLGDGTSLSGPVVVHSYAEAGTYTVVHTATDEFGCSDTFTTEITIAPVPTAEFAATPGTGCAPLEVAFANSAPQPGASCLWDFGDGAGSTACATAAHTYTVPGCYDVTLSVSAAGCTTTLTFPDVVCVEAAPQIGFFVTPDPVPATAPFASFVNNTSGASNFVWTFSAGTPSTSTASDPVLDLTGVDPGFFEACLVAISAAGCADSLCRIIPLLDDFRVHVPNAFTPNGDGINDVFLPVLIGQNSERYDLSIFDRWGEEIYRTQDADLGWDGRMQNGDVQDGVYVWRLTARASFGTETFERIGHVVLLR